MQRRLDSELALVVGGARSTTYSVQLLDHKIDLFTIHKSDRAECLETARKHGKQPKGCPRR